MLSTLGYICFGCTLGVLVNANSVNDILGSKDSSKLLSRLKRQIGSFGRGAMGGRATDPFAGFPDYLFSMFSTDPVQPINKAAAKITIPPITLPPAILPPNPGTLNPVVIGAPTDTYIVGFMTDPFTTKSRTTTPEPRNYFEVPLAGIRPVIGAPPNRNRNRGKPSGFVRKRPSRPMIPQEVIMQGSLPFGSGGFAGGSFMPPELRRTISEAASMPGGMSRLWMDPPDHFNPYMMYSMMNRGTPGTALALGLGGGLGGGFPGFRPQMHDGIPGRLADGPDVAQQAYRVNAAMRAFAPPPALPPVPAPARAPAAAPAPAQAQFPMQFPSLFGNPTLRQRPSPVAVSPFGSPAAPIAAAAPSIGTATRGAALKPFIMPPDLVRHGMPMMVDPFRAKTVAAVIARMRMQGSTADQIVDIVGDILMV